MFNKLIRYDVDFPKEAVEFYLDSIVHDSLFIREISLLGLRKIFFILRPKKISYQISFEHYQTVKSDEMNCYTSKDVFEDQIFLDKCYQGYLKIPIVQKKFESVKMNESLEIIAEKFKDNQFIGNYYSYFFKKI